MRQRLIPLHIDIATLMPHIHSQHSLMGDQPRLYMQKNIYTSFSIGWGRDTYSILSLVQHICLFFFNIFAVAEIFLFSPFLTRFVFLS